METGPSDHRGGGGEGNGPNVRIRRGFRSPRRVGRFCAKASAALFVVAILATGVLVARLTMGPIVVDGIGDKIASALHERFGQDLQFTVGETSIVQQGFTPTLNIDKFSVTAPDGSPILAAPKAQIAIDPFALLFGKVVPKRLEVFDITLRLVMLKNGNLAVAAGDGAKPFFEIGRKADPGPAPSEVVETLAPGTPRRAIVMKQAASGIRDFLNILTNPHSAIAAVDRLGISRGTLVIQDQETNDTTTYTGLDLSFDRDHGQSSFDLSAEGPSRRWSIDALATGSPGAERHFALKAQNLSIDELQLAMGSRSLGVDSDMPFNGNVDIGLKADDSLSEAAGGFALGPGFFRSDDPDQEPIFANAIEGGVRWNANTRTIEVGKLSYVDGGTHLSGIGTVHPPHDEGDPWLIDLAMNEPGLLAPDRKGQEPVPITDGTFTGRLLPDQKRFMVDKMSFKTAGGGGIGVAGQIDWVNGPHIRLGASVDPTPVAIVKRVWPSPIAAPVRAWLFSHFEAGLIQNATLKIDYDKTALMRMRGDRAPRDSSVELDFNVSNGRVAFLDGVPPLENVVGSAHVTGRTSQFTVNSATIQSATTPINVTDGSFSVVNADKRPIEANIKAHLAGTVEAVSDILARDALKPYASMPLDPATLHGHVEGMLDKKIFLGSDDKSKDELKVQAKVTDFVAERLIGKENLQDATLDINVSDGKMQASGQGKIFGGPATFEIDRDGTETPAATIAVTLDDAARNKLGLSAIQGLTGPISAHVTTALGDPAKMKAQVELDLTKASITAAYLGLTKPAGRPGKVTFTVASGPNKMIIDPVAADIGSFQARGSVDLAPDNSFQGAHFSSVKVSPGDDMKLDVSKGDDVFKLTIRGTTIDARPFLKALTSTPANDATPMARSAKAEKKEVDSFRGFDVDLKSGILTGANREVMSGVELKLSKRGSAFRQFNVQGRFGDKTVSGSMNAAQKITIASADAGALVSFIDLYKHMEGGHLAATIQLDEDELSGYLEMHDFTLRDEPALRRLVAQSTEVSAPGADTAAARRINAGAVSFKRLKVNFQREGSRLDLRDATMSGPDIGLSVDGWLDYSHDQVDMKGTFVPAFALNNLFSQIPVFGLFLGGKSNEGLLAITFRITGLVSAPTLTINPLSVIAPGIMRNIFGALDDAAYRGTQPQGAAPSR